MSVVAGDGDNPWMWSYSVGYQVHDVWNQMTRMTASSMATTMNPFFLAGMRMMATMTMMVNGDWTVGDKQVLVELVIYCYHHHLPLDSVGGAVIFVVLALHVMPIQHNRHLYW